MTVRWTVRAAEDRARSSRETESFPQRTLSGAVELSPSVLRRLENIVENSRSRGLSLRFLLIFFGHSAKTVINCFLLVYLPPLPKKRDDICHLVFFYAWVGGLEEER